MMKDKSTITLSIEDADNLITALEGYLNGFEVEETYVQMAKLGRRIEKAKCRMRGEEWSEDMSFFEIVFDAEFQRKYWG